ncbi:MAG: extracellular solute-binding protein [Chloroflexi bacterium]|nr:extracellular solute-binding protein [Chloroflexota bacterium]
MTKNVERGNSTARAGRLIRGGVLMGLVGLMALLVAACGGEDPTATPVPPQPTAPLDAAALFQVEWDTLLAAAQEEGEVVTFIAGSLGRSNLKDLLPRFEEKYGIAVIFSTGSSRQNADKTLAERAGGKFELDIWMGGSGTANTRLLPANALRPVEPLLFHPEVLDLDAWIDGRFHWLDADTQQYLFAFAANASKSDITYNTDLVDPNDIQSLQDLLDPKYKGQIIMRDPRLAGVGSVVLDYWTNPDVGEEFLLTLLTEMDVTIADDARQAAEQLALGKYMICLFACRSEVLKAENDGLPVEADFPHYTREGGRLSSGSGTLFLMDSPKNPNAQKFFANWWLSKEGQEMMQEASGNDSIRLDITKDTVAEGSRREDGVVYSWSESRLTYTQDLIDAAAFASEALASIGK